MRKTEHRKRPKRKGVKYEKPVSLWGMTFDEAVRKVVSAKPKSEKKRA
ncbi:MAG TPA: hypothetical protein VGZ47_06335 [Gemmataceae bacterium]|nr:hypothetical protein [Gemmataceae bacterium]